MAKNQANSKNAKDQDQGIFLSPPTNVNENYLKISARRQ